MDINKVKELFTNWPTKWLKLSGLIFEILEERHVRIVLPLGDELHTNHMSSAYAGSLFVIGEVAAGIMFFATHGIGEYIPIVKKAEIDYLKPCTTDMIVDLTMSKEESEEKICKIRKRGAGEYTYHITITNTQGEAVAKMTNTLYILPDRDQSMMKISGGDRLEHSL